MSAADAGTFLPRHAERRLPNGCSLRMVMDAAPAIVSVPDSKSVTHCDKLKLALRSARVSILHSKLLPASLYAWSIIRACVSRSHVASACRESSTKTYSCTDMTSGDLALLLRMWMGEITPVFNERVRCRPPLFRIAVLQEWA